MIKHSFQVTGVDSKDNPFRSSCIGYQIEDICKLYKKHSLYPNSVILINQVGSNEVIGIRNIIHTDDKNNMTYKYFISYYVSSDGKTNDGPGNTVLDLDILIDTKESIRIAECTIAHNLRKDKNMKIDKIVISNIVLINISNKYV